MSHDYTAIQIRTKDPETKVKVATAIHEQLAGSLDYVMNRVVLNMETEDNVDDCSMTLYVGNEAINPVNLNLTIMPGGDIYVEDRKRLSLRTNNKPTTSTQ